ncbi:HlyD family secretion protein [Sphingomonas sp.]|uniref:HlyD family secretion protein n=1 Tax=Sphingomonas sp. TaxID=28214 RepID=UPI003AFFF126
MADDEKQGDREDERDEQDKDRDHPAKARWPWFVGGAIVFLFIVVVLLLIFWPRSRVKTDDAYVTAHYAMVAPRVAGQIARVLVEDNQTVRRGQLLAEIDPATFRAQLDQALATRAQDLAQVEQAAAQVGRQPALIRQARAQVAASDAALALSHANAARYTNLSETGAGSVQQRQQAVAQLRQDEAGREQAQANLVAARRQLDALRADQASARARLDGDDASIRQARLNLGYTRITAPIDGTVDQRSVQVGNYAAPGAALMVLVPLHDVYIAANYRELALRHVRPGQPVRIHVDAYDIWLNGFVQSLPPSSGAAYSPIPPNNATGNFTKIVQRLPVKIVVAPNQPLARLLRVGMSVETWVDTGLHDVVAAQGGSRGRVTAPDARAPAPPPGTHP